MNIYISDKEKVKFENGKLKVLKSISADVDELKSLEQHDKELLQEFSSKIVKRLSNKYSVAHSELLLQISFDIANLLEGEMCNGKIDNELEDENIKH